MLVIVWKIALALAALVIAAHYATESFKAAKDVYHLSAKPKSSSK